MPQTASLIHTLKTCLKAERKTYADVAKLLGLSEASVKRLFAKEDFTLARLDIVCQMLGMEMSDLVQKMNDSRHRLECLSPQQERELIEDMPLMIVTVCVFNRWTVQQIVKMYKLSEAECVRKLVRLDQLKIIELMPGNRVKLLISPNFKWLDNGPIQQFFRQTVGREFFDTDFQQNGECLLVLNGMLSAASSIEFQRKLERIAKEFNDINDYDAALPFEQRKGTTLVMAMRNWEYGFFQNMLRKLPS
jgi:DNA-binding Xre family transcriptional regulator/DNA-binding Lrp family transcriptional regulator